MSDVLASAAMPIYEYRCTACEKEFEYQQRMADDPKTVCEACSGKLERILSRSSFHLKGGGWYKDLYASTKPGDGGGSGGGSSSASSDTASSSTSSPSSGGDGGGTPAAAPAASSTSGSGGGSSGGSAASS